MNRKRQRDEHPAEDPPAEKAQNPFVAIMKRQKLLADGMNVINEEVVSRLNGLWEASKVVNNNVMVAEQKLDYIIDRVMSVAEATATALPQAARATVESAVESARPSVEQELLSYFASARFKPGKSSTSSSSKWLTRFRKHMLWTSRPFCNLGAEPNPAEVRDGHWLQVQMTRADSITRLCSKPAYSWGLPGLTRAQLIDTVLTELRGIVSDVDWLALRIRELHVLLDDACRSYLTKVGMGAASETEAAPAPAPAPPPVPTSVPPPAALYRIGPIEISVPMEIGSTAGPQSQSAAPVEPKSSPAPEVETAPAAPMETAPPTEVETAPAPEVETAPPTEVETAPAPEVETAPPAEVETAPAPEVETPPPTEVETAPAPEVETSTSGPREKGEKVKRGVKAERIAKRLAELEPAKPDPVFEDLAETLPKPKELSTEGWDALWAVCETDKRRVLDGIRWLARHYFAAGVSASAAPHIAEAARSLQTLGANSPVLKAIVKRGKKKGHVNMCNPNRI